MKRIIVIALIFFILQSCGEQASNTQTIKDSINTRNVDTIKQNINSEQQLVSKSDTISPQTGLISEKILGIWGLVGDENSNFDIQKNKITYTELFKSYKYKIVNDSLKIKYDDYEGAFLITMKGKDTLILSGDEEQVYHRIKK